MPNPPDAATDEQIEAVKKLHRLLAEPHREDQRYWEGCQTCSLIARIDADRATAVATAQRLCEVEAELVALRASHDQQAAAHEAAIEAYRIDYAAQSETIAELKKRVEKK